MKLKPLRSFQSFTRMCYSILRLRMASPFYRNSAFRVTPGYCVLCALEISRMNWEAIGAIGETLGALGVIVSLIYLAIQVRSAERVVKVESRQRFYERWEAQTLDDAKNADKILLLQKMGASLSDDHEEEETVAWVSHIVAWFIRLQADYELYKDGVLDESDFEFMVQERIERRLKNQPRIKISWSRARGMFRLDFRSFMDSELDHKDADSSTFK